MESATSTITGDVKDVEDFGSNPKGIYDRWEAEFAECKKEGERVHFVKNGKKAIDVFSNQIFSEERRVDIQYNIYWSYVTAMQDIVYAAPPVPVVRARDGLRTPYAIEAENILQRNMARFITDPHSSFFKRSQRMVFDFLVPGRGVLWPRFEPASDGEDRVDLKPGESAPDDVDVQSDEKGEYYTVKNFTKERVVVDYVPWQDYFESASKTQEGVRWRAKRAYLSKSEVEETFGKAIAEELEYKSKFESVSDDEQEFKHRLFGRAEVREFHCLEDRKVYWISPGYEKPLKVAPAPLGLDDFWPVPEPLCTSLTNESTYPVCDYKVFGYLVDKINELTVRIGNIIGACKVVGAFDASHKDIKSIFVSMDTTMIPVEDWEAFAEAGGIEGVTNFMPLEVFIKGIDGLRTQCGAYEQKFGEISGYSEIMRLNDDGMSSKDKQKLGNFSNVRVSKKQGAVQDYMESLLAIIAEIICKQFSPETLLEYAGIDLATVADPEKRKNILLGLTLLKDSFKRSFTITVQTDSTIATNERIEKQQRIEFSNASTQFFSAFQTMAQVAPEFIDAAVEIFLFNLDAFRCARPVEEKLRMGLEAYKAKLNAPPEPPPPDPKMLAVQQNYEIKTQELQQAMMAMQGEAQQKAADAQMKYNIKLMEHQEKQREFQETLMAKLQQFTQELQYKFEMMQAQMAIAGQANQTDLIKAQMKSSTDAQVKAQAAEIQAQTELQKEALKLSGQSDLESRRMMFDAQVEMNKPPEMPAPPAQPTSINIDLSKGK